DNPNRFALVDREGDAVDGLDCADLALEDQAARDSEVLLEVLDDEQLVAMQLELRGRFRRDRRHAVASLEMAPSSRAASRAFVSPSRWHACRCSDSPVTGRRSGSTERQTSMAYAQRGWNRQPRGGRSSDGGWPSIWTRRATSASSRGREPIRPHV